ncbi:hypothetical protein Rs2_11251 [Raphanus sativus]|nr:hypothetical protein Rs2_11251 [Raphanus sativus]
MVITRAYHKQAIAIGFSSSRCSSRVHIPTPSSSPRFFPTPSSQETEVVRCSITRRERHEKRVRDEVETLHKKNLKGEISSDDLEAKVIRFGITPTPDLMGEFKTLLKMKNSAPLVTRVAERERKNESDAKKPPKQGWIEEDVKRLGDEVEKEMGKGTDDGLAAAVKKIKKTLAHYGAIPSDTEARRLAGLGKKDFQKAVCERIETQRINLRKWNERTMEKTKRVENGDGGGNLGGTTVNYNMMNIYYFNMSEDKGKKPSGGGKGKAGGTWRRRRRAVEETTWSVEMAVHQFRVSVFTSLFRRL